MSVKLFTPRLPKGVSQSKWNALFYATYNTEWKRLWYASPTPEQKNSFAYRIAGFLYRRGFSREEIVSIWVKWCRKHTIAANLKHFRDYVLPKAYDFSLPYMIIGLENRRRKDRTRKALSRGIPAEQINPLRRFEQLLEFAATKNFIKAADVAEHFGITRGSAQAMLSRYTEANLLERFDRGAYRTPVNGERNAL